MARIRTIKPEFWRSETVASWDCRSRLAYIGLWNVADDEGRIRYVPALLKADLFPFEDVDMVTVLQPIIDSGKVVKYEVDGREYIQVVNWDMHQKIKHPSASKFPAMPEGWSTRGKPTPSLPQASPSVGPRNREQGKEQGTGNREHDTGGGAAALAHFNEQTGGKLKSKAYIAAANARLNEGATLEDLKLVTVWALQAADAKYLRDGNYANPDTLWRPGKFPKYLKAATEWKESRVGRRHPQPQPWQDEPIVRAPTGEELFQTSGGRWVTRNSVEWRDENGEWVRA